MRRPWRIRWWCTAAVASSRRDRDAVRSDRPVGQDQDVVVGQHRGRWRRWQSCSSARSSPAAPSAAGQVVSSVAVRKAPSASSAMERIFSRSALVRIGWRDFQALVRAGLVAEQVRARADHRDQAHHQLLADRVDRRVGDLGEVLLEVVVEQAWALGEHGDRRVRAHRADRIVAAARHRLQEEARGLPGCSRTPAGDRGSRPGRWRWAGAHSGGSGRSSSLNWVCAQPLLVGLGLGERGLDLLVLDDAALFHVDQQHLAGLQAPLADDLLLRDAAARRPPRP